MVILYCYLENKKSPINKGILISKIDNKNTSSSSFKSNIQNFNTINNNNEINLYRDNEMKFPIIS